MSIKKSGATVAAAAVVCAALAGIHTSAATQHEKAEHKGAALTKAVAILHHTEGSQAKGRITFTLHEDGMHVAGEISGLTPGKHGFHVHEYGVWSPDGKAAGGHFNPDSAKHGEREGAVRHIGDLGNLEANANGNATIDFVDKHLTFRGAHSIIGRGLVVHEKADDYGQPVGNAGGRVAVGVIGIAQP